MVSGLRSLDWVVPIGATNTEGIEATLEISDFIGIEPKSKRLVDDDMRGESIVRATREDRKSGDLTCSVINYGCRRRLSARQRDIHCGWRSIARSAVGDEYRRDHTRRGLVADGYLAGIIHATDFDRWLHCVTRARIGDGKAGNLPAGVDNRRGGCLGAPWEIWRTDDYRSARRVARSAINDVKAGNAVHIGLSRRSAPATSGECDLRAEEAGILTG